MPYHILHKPSDETLDRIAAIWWKFDAFFVGLVAGVGLYKFFLWRWF